MRGKLLVYLSSILLVVSCMIFTPAQGKVSAVTTEKISFNEVEPNNQMDQANTATPTDDIKGMLSNSEDADFYKLNMPYDGTVNLVAYLGNNPSDNAAYTYKYLMKLYDKDGNEIAQSEMEEDDTQPNSPERNYQILYTTVKKGEYYFSIQSKGKSDIENQSYTIYQGHKFTPDFSIDSFTSNLPSPQIDGSSITFQANSQSNGLEYQFYVENTVVQKFSSKNTFTWKTPKPGRYNIKVEVRNPQYPYITISKETTFRIKTFKADFSLKSITPSAKKPIMKGETVLLQANGSKSKLQYRFSINNKVVKGFSQTNSYKWKPAKTGKYNVKVEVRRSEHPNSIISKQVTYDVTDGKVRISSLKANLSSPRPVSTNIKWTAKASGINLEYKFSVYENKKWKTIKNYSTKNYVNWQPKKSGSYKVKVTVHSKATGKTATKVSTYTIFKPSSFSIVSLKASQKSPVKAETKINFTAKGKGSYLEYRFRVYNGFYWDTVQNYSSKKTYSGIPYNKGTYKVAVDVRQKGTKKVKTKILTFKVK